MKAWPCSAAADDQLLDLLAAAYRVRHRYFGNRVHLNFLINAKSGHCGENCGYCSQSRVSTAEIPRYNLVDEEKLLDGARIAAEFRSKTYCIVISGRSPTDRELEVIASTVPRIKAKYNLAICASVGLLSPEQAALLKAGGVDRVNHNLNTSRRFYPNICTTHTYQERLDTLDVVRRAGLEICSGGIVGMGEEDVDVVELALQLGRLQGRGHADQLFAAHRRHAACRHVAAESAILPESAGPVPIGQSQMRTAHRRRPRNAPRTVATAGPISGQFDFRRRLSDDQRPAAGGRFEDDRSPRIRGRYRRK